ncbi:MAG: monooxygenase [Myxococcales bacterium]|nr:monooxygenase [Myxococcales bacterium]
MTTNTSNSEHTYDVVVVGGGAAGVGVGVALKHAGIENFVVLDRHMIGSSFALWPNETRFITPSFPTNSIGMLDINSVAIGFSPAYNLEVEHPTGQQYASHLCSVADFFDLPVQEEIDVKQVREHDGLFHLETNTGTIKALHVIWAAGEFQYPRMNGFAGNEHCQHTATVPGYKSLEGDDFIIIGGYESGVDAAYHLAHRGKRVRLFDKSGPWEDESSDPSVALSTYSLERMRTPGFMEQVELFPHTAIESVKYTAGVYEVTAKNGDVFQTHTQPLWAGGFEGGHKLVADLFEKRGDGFPLLNENDESTMVPGLFLCGPAVRHDNHVFCFIYKYRQRFAVVAKAIATYLGLPAEYLETYRNWGMYLDDLSCCGEECVC